jgi:hypothetical protein
MFEEVKETNGCAMTFAAEGSCNFHRAQLSVVTPVTVDCLCGLVARVPGYRSRGPGSILGATRFSEK